MIGKTPLTKKGVLARPYWLELIAEGYQSRERLITIKRGKTWRQNWKLNSSTAELVVRVTYRGQRVPQASVWIDDHNIGETNEQGELSVNNAESGDHLLQIRHPLYVPESQALTLTPGKRVTRRVRLTGAFGYLTIDTSDLKMSLKRWANRDHGSPSESAEDSADDETRAKTKNESRETHLIAGPSIIWGGVTLSPPYKKVRVSAGKRWLQIRPPQDSDQVFGPASKKYQVRVGETLTIKPTWKRHVASISLRSRGVKSDVYIDDVKVGVTPYRSKLKTGAHTIRLTADGHTPYQTHIWLTRIGHKEEVDFEKRTLLQLRCGPILGQLSVDGVPVGLSPQTVDVTPGRHLVTCLARGAEVSSPVEISPGARLSRDLTISADLLGVAYQQRQRWRQGAIVTSGLGLALSAFGAWTLLQTLPDVTSQRDQAQRDWLNSVEVSARQSRALKWSESDAQARNAHLLGWSLLGSGLTLTGGGLGVWWAHHD
jgi:hypothetical protein